MFAAREKKMLSMACFLEGLYSATIRSYIQKTNLLPENLYEKICEKRLFVFVYFIYNLSLQFY